jgi:thrombospondin motif-containing protein 18
MQRNRINFAFKGECHELGCDGNIDSLAKEDTCGVCKGDDSTCKTFRKRFYPRGRGYVRVAEIPASRNVVIKQLNVSFLIIFIDINSIQSHMHQMKCTWS